MGKKLDDVLIKLGDEYKPLILRGSRFYLEVDIGKKAAGYGDTEVAEQFHDIFAIVPLRAPVGGMKVRIDGRTFVNYAQFESGIAVPGYVADNTDLPREAFVPNDSMILNFA